MRKLYMILSAVLWGVIGPNGAAAANNPFVDVEPGHWSYQAVAKLAHDGVIEGYGDDAFRGERRITRYEMAKMLARAMTKENLSREDQVLLDRAASEYASELAGLGVRVAALEEKSDRVTMTGLARLRLDTGNITPTKARVNEGRDSIGHSHIEVWTRGSVGNWTVIMQNESEFDMETGESYTDGLKINKLYAEGPLLGAKAQLGKFGALSSYGRIIDTEISGAQISFGKRLATQLSYGRLNQKRTLSDAHFFGQDGRGFSAGADTEYMAVQMKYPLSRATNVGATYGKLNNISKRNGDEITAQFGEVNVWEAGFDTKLGENWLWTTAYSRSNLGDVLDSSGREIENAGYFSELRYKKADLKTKGSYAIFLNYRNVGPFSGIDGAVDYTENVKGWTIGLDYIPMENTQIEIFYIDGKQVNATEGKERQDVRILRTQVEFSF